MRKSLKMKTVVMGIALLSIVGCNCNTKSNSACCSKDGECTEQCEGCDKPCDKQSKNKKEMTYSKKYTNADFYKDGKFDQTVAIAAMKDMFEFYDVPFTELMAKDLWVTDFGLGDFENVGMGGIFWVNDADHGYFAHAIYLLPGQMIPEHAHVKTKFPAKHEAWSVTKGWAYNFSEVGDATPNAPAIPASHGPVKSKNFVVQKVGDILTLKESLTFHFLMAGPEGAIVDEWASYHDNDGLRFTNTKAAL